MLTKLVDATGYRLSLQLFHPQANRSALANTKLGRRLRRHRRAVIELAASCGANNVRVFGSVARGDADESSDIDLLVDFEKPVSVISLAGLSRRLSEILRAPVDVVPADMLKPAARKTVIAEAVALESA